VIEAHWLFGLAPTAIDVLIHPQSIVHSMVEFRDGSVMAQLGDPDMRHPIQYALSYPERWEGMTRQLDLAALSALTFESPDRATFRCLDLAYAAAAAGGDAPARLNAANEVAVAAFLDGRVRFLDIPRVIEAVLARAAPRPIVELDDVLAADRQARRMAADWIAEESLRR